MSDPNPYQSPSSEVMDESNSPGVLGPPQSMPAGCGWSWIAEGFAIFRAGPGPWMGMMIVYVLIMFVVGILPLISIVLVNILAPLLMAGFMIASRRGATSGRIEFADMFAAVQGKSTPLILFGLIVLGFSALIMIICGVLFFSSVADSMDAAQFGGAPDAKFLLAVLIYLGLLIPLMMGAWFAPALIVFHDLGPWDAFTTSFKGCLVNIIPFLLYGIISLILMIPAMIPLFLGMLVLGPTLIGSIYAAYKDIFLVTEQQ
ncbi:BPSS1780 family membrane protein [Hahella sp. HN01]|uniref:BPSS1780 family membrane protein n=1 Tax=Hahella sp. HN01 TaxID=2847262 RepID=UPI001C1EA429|nr:hypothetical protein [Hahella sp. HN01]